MYSFGYQSFAVLHVSLSRLIVADLPRRLPTWAPIEFYAAFGGMDSVENCMDFIADRDTSLRGWRLFSTIQKMPDGKLAQLITGFEPLMIRGEAIAYARPANDHFLIAENATNLATRDDVPEELLDLLTGKHG